MPPLTEPDQIRALLERDRNWAVYALGDLEPPHARHAEWRATPDGSALALVYRGFGRPVLFTLGAPDALAALLDEIDEPELYLLVRPEVLPVIQARRTVGPLQAMWRLVWAGGDLRAAAAAWAEAIRPVRVEDFEALEALYADGAAAGEAPDFFNRGQVEQGVFFGVWEAGALMAAAGTHLRSTRLSLGAIGNVYVRRDRRGRGLGRAVTAAVTRALAEAGLRTIALNVAQTNAAALRVYQALGFQCYCPFYEGIATR